MSYEDYLIREAQAGDDRWCSKCEHTLEDCLCSEEGSAGEGSVALTLDQTESFSAWLDAQGDALAEPTSFTEWLNQNEDTI